MNFLRILFLVSPLLAWAEEPKSPEGRIDAVPIQALETYANPKNHGLALGAGIFPLDPYFFAFGIHASYTYFFNSSLAWEMIDGSYAFTVRKNLSSELADKYNVRPETIERLEYVIASSLMVLPTYGKTVLFKSVLQNIRTGLLIGPGFYKTSLTSGPTVHLGAMFENYIDETFSWRLEIRDHIGLSDGKNFFSINLGTAVYL